MNNSLAAASRALWMPMTLSTVKLFSKNLWDLLPGNWNSVWGLPASCIWDFWELVGQETLYSTARRTDRIAKMWNLNFCRRELCSIANHRSKVLLRYKPAWYKLDIYFVKKITPVIYSEVRTSFHGFLPIARYHSKTYFSVIHVVQKTTHICTESQEMQYMRFDTL